MAGDAKGMPGVGAPQPNLTNVGLRALGQPRRIGGAYGANDGPGSFRDAVLTAEVPDDEEARLAALAACSIVGTPREPAFDGIVFTAAQLFRVPIAMVTMIGAKTVWSKAGVGPIAQTSDREQSFCSWLVGRRDVLIVEDAVNDGRFARLDSVVREPRVRFCAAAPVFSADGYVVGCISVQDRHPRSVPDRQRFQLQQLARDVGELLRVRLKFGTEQR